MVRTKQKKKAASQDGSKKSLWEEFKNLPNILTMLRIAVIPIICALIWEQTPILSYMAAWFYGLAALTDMADGYLARRNNQITVLGKFLDPLADKLLVLSLLLVMLALKRVPLWVVVVLVMREIIIMGLRSIASSEGMVIAADTYGKIKTAFQMIALIAMCIHYPYMVNFGIFESELDFNRIGVSLLYISVFFSVYSAGEYFLGFFREMKTLRSDPEYKKEKQSRRAK